MSDKNLELSLEVVKKYIEQNQNKNISVDDTSHMVKAIYETLSSFETQPSVKHI